MFRLMCQSVNIFWIIAVYIVDYVLGYFCGGHRNHFLVIIRGCL